MTKAFLVHFILVFIGFSDTWHLSSLQLSSAPDERKEVIIQNLRSFWVSLKEFHKSNDECQNVSLSFMGTPMISVAV